MADVYTPSKEQLDESVDEILDQIMGKDGGFNSEFTELYAKYLGGRAVEMADALTVDLSDRSGEPQKSPRLEYEDPDIKRRAKAYRENKVTDRMPSGLRESYISAEKQAQSPEFTAGGEVRYPIMGIGEAEERVVFDADWEEKARQEAAQREAYRRENMLRGDSTFARTFVTGGRNMTGNIPPVNVNPAFIDPLTTDDDIRRFEAPDYSVTQKREKSLEEMFGRADEEEKKGGLFRKGKKNK